MYLVEEVFNKLKKEFEECEADESDKAIKVMHANLQKAIDRKYMAFVRLIEVSQQLASELKSYRVNLQLNPSEFHSRHDSNNEPVHNKEEDEKSVLSHPVPLSSTPDTVKSAIEDDKQRRYFIILS